MKFDYLKLAEIIKKTRMEKNISTRKLAESIGVSHAEISRFENGLKPNFYFIPFIKLCKELDLDLFVLLKTIGLYDNDFKNIYIVKITNVNEDYFEIKAENDFDAASKVLEFVINNDIIEMDFNKKFYIEAEQVDTISKEEATENIRKYYLNNECEICKYYCSKCGRCTFGE